MHPIPTECPLPHLEKLWRGQKTLRLATTGNLTFAAATQDITSPPSYIPLLEPPQLCSLPLSSSYTRYEDTRETHLDPPSSRSLPPSLPLPPPTSSTTPFQFGTILQSWPPKRRRSVSLLLPPLLSGSPPPLLHSSPPAAPAALPAPYDSGLGCTGALPRHLHCASSLDRASNLFNATLDRLPSSVAVVVPMLDGFESASPLVCGPHTDPPL